MLDNLFLNEDITFEILARLPAKEIARLLCVCKRWLFLVSDPRFIMYHSARNPHPFASGFFLRSGYRTEYLPLNQNSPGLPDSSLSFIPDTAERARVSIESSCNGLIICRRAIGPKFRKYKYYVCNPTTREFVEIPIPKYLYRCFLAFDPSKSPHYRVVSIASQIHIYSSETHTWNISSCMESLRKYGGREVLRTVFWNGALTWTANEFLLSFDVEGECLKELPLPPEPYNLSAVLYIGESRGKLQMIGKAEKETMLLDILEMDTQCSGWSVLYHLDMNPMKDLFPEINQRWRVCVSGSGRNFVGRLHNVPAKSSQGFSPVYFIRGTEEGGDEEGTLLLSIPKKIVSYDLRNKVFGMVFDVLNPRPIDWNVLYPFGHTLFSL